MPTQDQYLAPILYIDKATRERDTAVIARGLTGIDLTNIYLTFVNIVAGLGGGSTAYTSISVATAAAGGLTDGGNYAVEDIDGITGATFYSIGLPDGTLAKHGTSDFNGFAWDIIYDPATDICLSAVSNFGWTFLYSPMTSKGALNVCNSYFTMGADATLMSGCVMGGVNFGGFTYTAPAGAVVKWINLTISETTTLDLSALSVDKTLSGVMQSGTITVPSHCGDDLTTFNFPAYFSNSHLQEDKLIIFSALGTQRSTMYYDGNYTITGLEYGSCDYDPVANTIKNSTLEVDLGTLGAAASTIDLAPVTFAGTVRVTADAGGNTITDVTNGTDGEQYKVRQMDAIGMSYDGSGTTNIVYAGLILAVIAPGYILFPTQYSLTTFRFVSTDAWLMFSDGQ